MYIFSSKIFTFSIKKRKIFTSITLLTNKNNELMIKYILILGQGPELRIPYSEKSKTSVWNWKQELFHNIRKYYINPKNS